VIARVLLAVAALAAAAWVGASLRSAQLEAQAGEALGGSDPGRVAKAADLFERARKWAPYQAPVASEIPLLYSTGRQRRAIQLTDDLVRREPENPIAWSVLASVSPDPARRRVARRRLRELSPPVERR